LAENWVVIVRNDEWLFPDVFGPFPDRTAAETFYDMYINHKVVDDADVNVQQLLEPSYYEDDKEYSNG